ncbi:iron ABC transporter permease [Nitratireductor sp. ac15]
MALRDDVASAPGWRWQAVAGGDRSARARAVILALVVLYALLFVFSLGWGASETSLWVVLSEWLGGGADALSLRDRVVIGDIRLPRVVLGSLIGASLAVSGAVMQGLFRNPLADPGIVGVGSGAGLGAIIVIVLGNTVLAPVVGMFGIYALPLAAFFGGVVSTLLLYRVATRRGQTSIATMLLAGIALGALAGALSGIFVYVADDQELRDLTFWGLGSLAGASWTKIWAAGPIILAALGAAPFLARGLDAMVLGEATAHHLGVRVQRVKNCAILAVAAATGASVAVAGSIGFVGIVVPHLLRLTIGPEHRYLLPASALLGAVLLLVADAISRVVVAPAELPIGIVTATLGAPFFLWILLRQRGILDL